MMTNQSVYMWWREPADFAFSKSGAASCRRDFDHLGKTGATTRDIEFLLGSLAWLLCPLTDALLLTSLSAAALILLLQY